jgi:hypothetical protein
MGGVPLGLRRGLQRGLQYLPFRALNSGVAKNPSQEAGADVTTVWVGDTDGLGTLPHELVLASGVGPSNPNRLR